MITEDKVIELFCFADDFCKFFDRMVAKYTFKSSETANCAWKSVLLWGHL